LDDERLIAVKGMPTLTLEEVAAEAAVSEGGAIIFRVSKP